MSNNCPNCGAAMTNSDKCCKYCGTANPNYVKPASSSSFFSSSSSLSSQSSSSTENSSSDVDNSKINWLAFIVLLILFWPAAIIYFIVKISKRYWHHFISVVKYFSQIT